MHGWTKSTWTTPWLLQVEGEDGQETYQLLKGNSGAGQPTDATSPLTSVPCGVCPVFDRCHDGGVISPATCVYFQKWLDF
jgi:hypothetical protein